MEVSVKREDLVQGLYLVQGVVERRNTQPILAHVLIEPGDGGIALSATDMEVGLRCQLPAQPRRRAAPPRSNARKLYEIAREVTADEVTLRYQHGGLGRGHRRALALQGRELPAEGLPRASARSRRRRRHPDPGRGRDAARDDRQDAVRRVDRRDALQPLRASTWRRSSGGLLRMVATDGHRLAMIDRAVADAKLPRGVIMSAQGAGRGPQAPRRDRRGRADAGGRREGRPRAHAGRRLLHAAHRGRVPRLQAGDPLGDARAGAGRRATIFLAALRRTSLLASERSHGVKLHLQTGTLELSASNPDAGRGQRGPRGGVQRATRSRIGFNGKYLIDVLGVHAAGDTIDSGSPTRSGLACSTARRTRATPTS